MKVRKSAKHLAVGAASAADGTDGQYLVCRTLARRQRSTQKLHGSSSPSVIMRRDKRRENDSSAIRDIRQERRSGVRAGFKTHNGPK